MARQIENDKGFLVIQCTVGELMQIEPGTMGICDYCNNADLQGYIPCVLGHKWYCNKCYHEWIQRAVNYPDDKEFEYRVFADFKRRLVNAKLWSE